MYYSHEVACECQFKGQVPYKYSTFLVESVIGVAVQGGPRCNVEETEISWFNT